MAYTGTKVTCEGATCTFAAAELAAGGTITANINYSLETEDINVWGSYPDTITIGTKLKASGTIEYYANSGTLPVLPTGTPVAMIIKLPSAFQHSQSVLITSCDFNPSAEDNISKVTIAWEGAAAYTVTVAGA